MPQCWLSNSTAQAMAWMRVKTGSLSLDSLELLPLVLGDVLGNEGVLGLDGGERPIDLGWHWLVLARVTSGEGLVFFPQGVHTVNHLLDQLDLRVSEPVLVGDVIGVSGLATRFTTGSTGAVGEAPRNGPSACQCCAWS